MQIEALSNFQFAAELPNNGHSSGKISLLDGSFVEEVDASDPSILAIWSPAPHQTSSSVASSPQGPASQPSSPLSTIAPWSQDSLPSTVAAWPPNPTKRAPSTSGDDTPRTPPGQVPGFYEDAFWSDGYDSESIRPIAHLRPSASWVVAHPNDYIGDNGSGLSPGWSRLTGTKHGGPSSDHTYQHATEPEVWIPEDWPGDVELLTQQLNPNIWKFHPVSMGIRDGAGCGCESRCTAKTCLNARESRFCMEQNCSFAGYCGNALNAHPSLLLARSKRSGMRGVVTTARIPAGEVIGQYTGRLDLFGLPCKNGPRNDGYRMHVKTRAKGNRHVGIDAISQGGLVRFLNHACNPSARFHEVQVGRTLTVVAVTIRDVAAGEQVTVSYGNTLWFVCRCKWEGCQHRDIQNLEYDASVESPRKKS